MALGPPASHYAAGSLRASARAHAAPQGLWGRREGGGPRIRPASPAVRYVFHTFIDAFLVVSWVSQGKSWENMGRGRFQGPEDGRFHAHFSRRERRRQPRLAASWKYSLLPCMMLYLKHMMYMQDRHSSSFFPHINLVLRLLLASSSLVALLQPSFPVAIGAHHHL